MLNLSFSAPLIAIFSIEMVAMLVKLSSCFTRGWAQCHATILCEFGPPLYAMAGHDGKELSRCLRRSADHEDLIQALAGLHH